MYVEHRKLMRSLAGGGLVLVLVVLSLSISRAAGVSPSLASPGYVASTLPAYYSSGALLETRASATTTGNTAFLPLISRHEAASNIWQAEYYDNQWLNGQPVRTGPEVRIDYDWGDEGPPDLPDDRFSIRWTGEWDFELGEYTFFVYSDDGIKLWLDDQLLLDVWSPGMGNYEEPVLVEQAGPHRVKVEYFESRGDAAISVRWRRTDLYPQWYGQYFDNPWVEGNRRFDRDDSAIQFDWGEDCPEDLPPNSCNRFSVRWEATPVFEPGTHRIHVYGNQGYRLYVDENLEGDDGWYSGESGEDDYYDIEVDRVETRDVRYDFHDQGGSAEARLWIVNLAHPLWQAEYFSNRHLLDPPDLTREETAIFHDWKLEKPAHGLPTNNFSVRWTGERYFHAGFYRFGLFSDDGVRLYVDGEQLVNAWSLGRAEHQAPITFLTTGYHEVIVEYFEAEGEAEIRYWWD
jgi:hypothetical protein